MNEVCGEWKFRLYGVCGGSVVVVMWVGDVLWVIFWVEVGFFRYVLW